MEVFLPLLCYNQTCNANYMLAIISLIQKFQELNIKITVYPIFFVSNALLQGMKKATHVMFLTMFRMAILPLLTLSYLIIYLKSSFDFVFWGLLVINWIFGIFLLLFTKKIMKKEFSKFK